MFPASGIKKGRHSALAGAFCCAALILGLNEPTRLCAEDQGAATAASTAEATAADDEAKKAAEAAKKIADQDERRRATLRFGTEAEIVELLDALQKEGADYLDKDLVSVLNDSSGTKVRIALFAYATKKKLPGAEDLAISLVGDAVSEDASLVEAAAAYLKATGTKKAAKVLREAAEDTDQRIAMAAIAALGRCGDDGDAQFLVDLYDKTDDAARKSALVGALGDLKSKKATSLLDDIVNSEDAGAGTKIRALDAIRSIADPASLKTVLGVVDAQDANLRQAAIEALGSFSGESVDAALLGALRDGYYKTRMAAAKAVSERKLRTAVPYLAYRANYDEVPQVREESLRALASIGGGEAENAIAKVFEDKKATERVRSVAGEAYLAIAPKRGVPALVEELDRAKKDKRTAFYNALAKALSGTESPLLEPLAVRLMASKELLDQLYGLDIIKKNHFTALKDSVRKLAEGSGSATLVRKAKETLEALK